MNNWKEEFDREFVMDDEDHIECVHDSPRLLKAFIHKAIQADRANTRQQLLKAVEGIDFYSIATHPDLIGKRWVDLDEVIDLLKESDSDKAKDNMEGGL